MPSDALALTDLLEISDLLLRQRRVRLCIASRSMAPTLRPGDEITVEPVSLGEVQAGDLILFQHNGRLICHRLIQVSGKPPTCLTRGEAARHGGERISFEQVLGKVVAIRKRTLWVGLKENLGSAVLPSLLRWLPRLQRLGIYRILLRPLVAPFVSYQLGLAEGSRWYRWHALGAGNGFPPLPASARRHLLLAKLGTDVVGRGVLSLGESAWQCEEVSVRLRYRGLGLESDLARLAQRIVRAQ